MPSSQITKTTRRIERTHRDKPLSSVHRGEVVQLTHIEAGRRLGQRLAELGLTPGVKIQVLHVNGGPILIGVRGARLALGRGMAEKILVTTLEDADV
ncbi:MAG: ferrous iron transport protein A [Clostridia bacterium]|nr:MAG: ferrous iron transport protein A [Clostridia bacterium]